MKVELSDKEREIIECMANAWDNDGGLYGGLSCQMVSDLLQKLDITVPPKLAQLCSDDFDPTEENILKFVSDSGK